MFRTVGDQPSLFESVLPPEVLRLPFELERVGALLDDPAFYSPFVPFFDPRIGRPSTPMESYLRLMFLKFRYRYVPDLFADLAHGPSTVPSCRRRCPSRPSAP